MINTFKKLVRKFINNQGYRIYPAISNAFDTQHELLKGTPIKTILDLGAVGGGEALIYKRLFPSATIHCFEQHLESYQELVRQFQNDDHIIVHNYAVTEKDGVVTLNVNNKSDTSSILSTNDEALSKENQINLKTEKRVEVQALTLKTFCDNNKINEIDLLKMDIQGGELMALKGIGNYLPTIKLIYSEVFFEAYYKDQPLFTDINHYLVTNGFSFHSFHNFGISGKTGKLLWSDVIFLGPCFKKSSHA